MPPSPPLLRGVLTHARWLNTESIETPISCAAQRDAVSDGAARASRRLWPGRPAVAPPRAHRGVNGGELLGAVAEGDDLGLRARARVSGGAGKQRGRTFRDLQLGCTERLIPAPGAHRAHEGEVQRVEEEHHVLACAAARRGGLSAGGGARARTAEAGRSTWKARGAAPL